MKVLNPTHTFPEGTTSMDHATDHPGAHDFDFIHGKWTIANRFLKSRLAGSDEWEEFEATQICTPVLRGIGNLSDFTPDWPSHPEYIAHALRFFDLTTDEWAIYWIDNVTGILQPPVHGRIHDGFGEFFGNDTEGGVPVQVRFRWSQITEVSAFWEQAFSADDGATWETNWTMEFTRVD
jgi:hypothetical protein